MRKEKLKRIILVPGLLVVALLAAILLTEPASGTSEYMIRLPAYSTYQCSICHTDDRPTAASADLNPFGMDFKSNGYVWNDSLAQRNSDGDKCPNGFELGDMDGDGILDEAGSFENGNPGVPDCNITLTKETWGIIKKIFSGE